MTKLKIYIFTLLYLTCQIHQMDPNPKVSINGRIPPAAMKVLDKLHKEQGIGLLKVIDLNNPAEIHFCAKPVNISS